MSNQQRRWGFGIRYQLGAVARGHRSGAAVSLDVLCQELLKSNPDWICCVAKGPGGHCSYPTGIASPSPEAGGDSLRLYREAAAELGIPFWIEYSAWLDRDAVRTRPEWAASGSAVARQAGVVCPRSGYVAERMLPQLRELLAGYALDGIWLAGAQGVFRCLCERCSEAGEGSTSVDPLLDACIRLVQAAGRHCALASDRWPLSVAEDAVPAIVMPIQRLPGAYGAERAAQLGRQLAGLAPQWALEVSPTLDAGEDVAGRCWKTATHLRQEAAVVAALGGSLLVGSPVDAEDRPISWQQDRLAEVARFWRDREPALRDTTPVAQALVLGAPGSEAAAGFPGNGDAGRAEEGALRALLELGWSTEWCAAAAVGAGVDRYPWIVVAGNHGPDAGGLLPDRNNPEKVAALLDRYGALSEDVRDAFRRMAVEAVRQGGPTAPGAPPENVLRIRAWLETYVWFGGCLLLAGEGLPGVWGSLLGVAPAGEARSGEHYVPAGAACVYAGSGWEPVSVRDAEPVLALCEGPDPVRDQLPYPAATRRNLGFGTVIGIYGPLLEQLQRCPQPETRTLLGALVQSAGVRPRLEGGLPPWLEVSLRRRRRELLVHLVNRGGEQAPCSHPAIIEAVPELRSVGLKIRIEGQPEEVRLVPDAPGLVWAWEEGVLTVHLPEVGVHEIVVVQLGTD